MSNNTFHFLTNSHTISETDAEGRVEAVVSRASVVSRRGEKYADSGLLPEPAKVRVSTWNHDTYFAKGSYKPRRSNTI